MAILKEFLGRRGKVIYLVPLKALAREKYEDLSAKYSAFGLKVSQSTGDFDSAEPWLAGADVVIATNEKIDSLIRHHAGWLGSVGLVIADEVHLLGDAGRGPTLEVVLVKLRLMNPRLRVVALSATIPNAGDMAEWLGARLVTSEWRPVPLREGVFYNGAAIFGDGTVRWVARKSGLDMIDLAMDTISEGGQALIFVNTRKAAEAASAKASEYVSETLETADFEFLRGLSEGVLRSTSEPTRLCRKLAEHASQGAAFHHAGISYAQRRLIEDAFKQGRLRVLASTTTLAMGLNLPSRRVIIRDWWRYESGMGMQPVPVIEVKQMSGRAGRPGLDSYGEAVLVARNKRDEKYLFDKYISGRPEDIESALASESALRTHVLALVAGAFARTKGELRGFLENTLSAHQRGTEYLFSLMHSILEFLESEGMIASKKDSLSATRFGRRVSELYIDPVSAVVLRDCLSRFEEKVSSSPDPFVFLHMTAKTPDMMHLSLKKKDYDEMLDIFYGHSEGLLIDEEERHPTDETLSEIKTASAVMQWILETHEDKITGHFGIGPGDLRTLVDRSDWLLYSAVEIGKALGLKASGRELSRLRLRVAYGVREELLELVSLKGIGRVRARNLFGAGYKTLKDIKAASAEALSLVSAIGPSLAEDIKRQALRASRPA